MKNSTTSTEDGNEESDHWRRCCSSTFFVLGVMMISMIAEGVYSDSAAAQQSQESGTVDPNEEIDFPVESMQEENSFFLHLKSWL